MRKGDWLYYLVAYFLVLVYFAGEAIGLLFFAMLIILPIGCWVIWNLNPERPNKQ